MNTTPTLEFVQAEFQQWRQTRTRLRSRTPAELRSKALALLEHHSPNDIRKALGITRGMLQTWEDQTSPLAARVAEPIEFVTLPVEPAPALPSTEPLRLELTQANGDHWSLQGDPSAAQLSAFVTALSGGAP